METTSVVGTETEQVETEPTQPETTVEADEQREEGLLDGDSVPEDPLLVVRGDVEPWVSSGPELSRSGCSRTERVCDCCETGRLWYGNSELVCERCGYVDGSDQPSPRERVVSSDSTVSFRVDRWESFHTNRPSYRNSSYLRCVGGFPSNYEWVRSEDLDRKPVSVVDPEKFYRD